MILENIKELCERNSITIKQLEREAGISNGTISRWDKSSPTIASLQKVADYFQVTINRLIKDRK